MSRKNNHLIGNTISMKEFLSNYVECASIYAPLESFSKLLDKNFNHLDLLELELPGIVQVSLNNIANYEIETGRIILVSSKGSNGHGYQTKAYLRPDLALMKSLLRDINYDESYLSNEEQYNLFLLKSLYPDDFSKTKGLKIKN